MKGIDSLEDLAAAFAKEKEEREKRPVCKGQIFRAVQDNWVGSAGDVNFRKRYRWMKSLSCSGCDQCHWYHDEIWDFLDGDLEAWSDKFVDQQLYELKVVHWTTDWETGICDDYYIGFVKYEPEASNSSS